MIVSSIIKRAMRNISVIQSGEELPYEESVDAVETLNSMLHAWEHDDIKLNHIDLAFSDTLPYPDNHIDPIMYNLAIRLAQEYGVDIPAYVVSGAESGYRNLQNYYLEVPNLDMPDELDSYYNPNGYNMW